MKFEEYRKLTTRTMSNTGSHVTDSAHMTLGLNTEIMAELPTALSTENLINFKEELGDTFWYLANYCNIWGITPVFEMDRDSIEEKRGLVKLNKTDGQQYMMIFTLGETVALLQDIDKKHLAYGKEGDETIRLDLINKLYTVLEYFSLLLNINTDEVRQTNIDKLNARYPEEGFTSERAINRDLDAELDILSK